MNPDLLWNCIARLRELRDESGKLASELASFDFPDDALASFDKKLGEWARYLNKVRGFIAKKKTPAKRRRKLK